MTKKYVLQEFMNLDYSDDLLTEEEHSNVLKQLADLDVGSKYQLSVSAMEEENLDGLILLILIYS